MKYTDFSNTFLLKLALSYRSGQISFHGLVDFHLWKAVFPNNESKSNNFDWRKIGFNAFQLNDKEQSLLIIYSIPHLYTPKEAEFIGIRLNKNRSNLLYYSLRRPKYNDDPWDIFLYDYKSQKDIFINKIQGTDSMREFKNAIEKLEFREPTKFEILRNSVF